MAAPNPLIIVGGGGLARETIWAARDIPENWTVCGILDDDPGRAGTAIDNVPVLGAIDDAGRFNGAHLLIAVGAPRTRASIAQRIRHQTDDQVRWATLCHPSAIVAPDVRILPGSIIGIRAILSSAVQIGAHSLINMGVIVAHDSVTGDFSTVAPGVVIPGAVTIGRGAEIALGATMRQGLSIGDGALIGMNATVTRDVPPAAVMIGSPARSCRMLDRF